MVNEFLSDPDFIAKNLPVRTLEVAVVVSGWMSDESIRWEFEAASELLRAQVGIALHVTVFREPVFGSRAFHVVHATLRDFRKTHPDFDIVVGLSLPEGAESYTCFLGFCFTGMIDPSVMNNFVIFTLSRDVIIHELGHVFLGIFHSERGVMMPSSEGVYFTLDDRERILRNKWKYLRHVPVEWDAVSP